MRKTLDEMKARLPEGLETTIALDTNDFVRLSIEEVIHTLAEALVLVVLVVYLFLQRFRTTLICAIAIVVSLVATFSGMLALGFSINLLTLFGLILAIGMVVDDAIVVCENVERNMVQHHLSPKDATIRSMGEIGSSLVAVVLVMASVFVPAAFLPGTTGQLYKQFAITIVVSVIISGFVALTLTPAMCALLLKHNPPPTKGFFAWFNRQVDRVTRAFGPAVEFVTKPMAIAFVLLGVFLYAIWHLFHTLPSSFVPQEDQGYAMVAIIMPQAASLERTQDVASRADAILAKIPGVATRSVVSGYSLVDAGFKTNAATIFITFNDFKERYKDIATAKEQNARAILTAFYDQAKHIQEAVVLPIAPPAIPGIGTTGGFEFWIQDTAAGSPVELGNNVQAFLAKARQRPELAGVNTTFNANSQQLRADVDREKAMLLQVPVQDVQRHPGAVRLVDRQPVQPVQPRLVGDRAVRRPIPPDAGRPDPAVHALQPGQDGAAVGSGGHELDGRAGPAAALQRLPGGEDHRQCRRRLQLRPGHRHDGGTGARAAAQPQLRWSGLAFEEKQSGGTSSLAFVFGLLIVFLVLAAQCESWTLPGAVMTAIPFGVLGALAVDHIRGLENDVYFQIGLLVLIGLGAKNAVLRVSAAVDFRKQGYSIMDATRLAGEQRLRPIIMTSLAFAVGVLPLAIAVGAGANARHSIGTGIIGGMLGETTLAMLYVPLFFYIFDRLGERKAAKAQNKPAGEAAPPKDA